MRSVSSVSSAPAVRRRRAHQRVVLLHREPDRGVLGERVRTHRLEERPRQRRPPHAERIRPREARIERREPHDGALRVAQEEEHVRLPLAQRRHVPARQGERRLDLRVVLGGDQRRPGRVPTGHAPHVLPG